MDVVLVKELIKLYNPISKAFHSKDRIILLALDKETFVEAFDLGGLISLPIYMDKLNEFFKKIDDLLHG